MKTSIQELIGEEAYTIDSIGQSGSQVICMKDMVLKIEGQCEESDNEHKMMEWLDGKIPVPRILCLEKKDNVNHLLMSKIEGKMLCDTQYLENPKGLVRLLAEGLRMLWDVNVSECPYHNGVDNKIKLAQVRVQNNDCDMDNVERDTYGKDGFANPAQLLEWLIENKPEEELVLSHGDYCLPNIFAKNNKISGFIDLGRSGIADKYQDIALCYRSLKDNMEGAYGGKRYENFNPELLFEELDIVPNWDKIKYYILMDELF